MADSVSSTVDTRTKPVGAAAPPAPTRHDDLAAANEAMAQRDADDLAMRDAMAEAAEADAATVRQSVRVSEPVPAAEPVDTRKSGK